MIFGTDGIRAEAGTHPLDVETIHKLSFVLHTEFPAGSRIVIGRDTRESGRKVQSWILHGLEGWKVTDLGVVPTPVVAFETKARDAALGVMVTASHNPSQYNGLKFFDHRGLKVTQATAKSWSDQIRSVDYPTRGRDSVHAKAEPKYYRELVLTHFGPDDFSGLRIGMDCAHGACYRLIQQIVTDLVLDVTFLGTSPDGFNINRGFGSLYPERLARMVVDQGLDVGFAFDGDGDRLVVVDREGKTVGGDVTLYAMKTCFERENVVMRDLVGTIMCGFGLERVLTREGVTLHRTPVGDQSVLALMQEKGFVLGGEPSGHLIQADLFPAGDGFLAALRLAKHVAAWPDLLSHVQDKVPVLPAYEHAYVVRHKPPLDEVPCVSQSFEELKNRLSGNGRAVFRYSGTEPKLRLWVESDQLDKMKTPIEKLERAIEKELM